MRRRPPVKVAVAVGVSVPLHPSGMLEPGVSTFLIMLMRYKACLFFPFLDLILGDKWDVGHVRTLRWFIQPINTKPVVAAAAAAAASAMHSLAEWPSCAQSYFLYCRFQHSAIINSEVGCYLFLFLHRAPLASKSLCLLQRDISFGGFH